MYSVELFNFVGPEPQRFLASWRLATLDYCGIFYYIFYSDTYYELISGGDICRAEDSKRPGRIAQDKDEAQLFYLWQKPKREWKIDES